MTKSKEQKCATEERSLNIEEFCLLEGISKPTYFKMRKLGQGPVETCFLNCVRISFEARQAWHKARQNKNAPGYQEAKAKLLHRSKLGSAARHPA